MGEAKQKLRAHAAILADAPGCIYCAGENVATTIEHMPPISVFEGRQRPKGLEFPACQQCNNGTRLSDLVAAMLSRAWPNPTTYVQTGDAKRLFNAVANNLPDVLWEMDIGRAGEKLARKRNNIPADAHPLRMDGPLLTAHLETFAAKMGFALHYELRGAPVPALGGIKPMWFSNLQALNGQIPDILFQMLPSPSTKVQKTSEANFSIRTRPARATTCSILHLSTSRSPSAALLRWIDPFIWKRATTSFLLSSGLGNFGDKLNAEPSPALCNHDRLWCRVLRRPTFRALLFGSRQCGDVTAGIAQRHQFAAAGIGNAPPLPRGN